MPLDLNNPDSWISHLLENLPEEKLACPLKDDNPDWEYIDGEIVKLGSLAHSQLDVPEIQRRGLKLLASETKDFRLLAHLLRTLQHAGDPLLAFRLLAFYVEHYWVKAAPEHMAYKKRFALQVIKRFDVGISGFAQNASPVQRDALLGELAKLAQCWQGHNAPELAQASDELFAQYQREFRDEMSVVATTSAASPVAEIPSHTVTPVPKMAIKEHNEDWRGKQLEVAALLCERQPELPLGFRLRRHALWQTITGLPQAESDGRTSLAAVPADMVSDYQTRLASADIALWTQIETSVLLAPYWLDGHYLSAQTAQRLGYTEVADAIRDEVSHFLERLPQLSDLLFNDRTPYMSDQTKLWLAVTSAGPVTSAVQAGEELQTARSCFNEDGLEAALRYLNTRPGSSPRELFYRQFSGAQFMEEAGMEQLAQQQYRMLFRIGSQIMLADWEPSLLEQLKHKFMAEQ